MILGSGSYPAIATKTICVMYLLTYKEITGKIKHETFKVLRDARICGRTALQHGGFIRLENKNGIPLCL